MKICPFVEKDNQLNMAGGDKECRGAVMDWNAHVHTHKITLGYLKGNFTA